MRSDEPLTSIEAFALALVEASSRLNVVPAAAPESERDPHAADVPLHDAIAAE